MRRLIIACVFLCSGIRDVSASDTTDVRVWLSKVRVYWRVQNDSVLYYADKAARLSEQLNYKRGLAEAYNAVSYVFERQSRLDTALVTRFKALELAIAVGDASLTAWSYHSLGNIYDYQGLPDSAIKQHFLALSIRETLGDRRNSGWSYNRIGEIFSNQNKLDWALKFQMKALELATETHATDLICSTHIGLSATHYRAKDFSLALASAKSALSFSEQLNDKYYHATAQLMLAQAFAAQGDDVQAVDLLRKALKLYRELERPIFISETYRKLAEINLRQGKYNNALIYAGDAIDIATAAKVRKETRDGYAILAEAYAALNDFEKALYYHKLSRAIQDSILNEERARVISVLEIAYEKQQQDQTIQLLSLERDKRNLIIYALATVVLLVIAILFLVSRQYVEKNRNEEILKEKNEIYDKMYQAEQDLRLQADILALDNEAQARSLEKLNRTLSETLEELERQRDEAEAQRKIAEQANAFKSELLGIAAHDLKNPLTVIMGYADLLRRNSTLSGAAAKMTTDIEKSAQQMLMLISDLLESSAAEAGKLDLQKRETDLAIIAYAAVEHNRITAAQKSQTIELDIKGKCVASVDTERIREAFENLISNAVKYSPLGKTIFVTLEPHAHFARFCVRDEGQGLSDEDKKKLFGRFQRLSARPTGNESSTGLGLSIVKQLVELHGGKVWAESDGKDKGSTFMIELPLLSEPCFNLVSQHNTSSV